MAGMAAEILRLRAVYIEFSEQLNNEPSFTFSAVSRGSERLMCNEIMGEVKRLERHNNKIIEHQQELVQ